MRRQLACVILAMGSALAQTAGPAFEAATIKPNKSGSGNSRTQSSRGRVTAENNTFESYIMRAFEVRDYQVAGPEWLKNERYDLNAKLPDGAEASAIPAMLRTLLIERFKLEFHRETKMMPALGLVVGRNGSKLTATTVPGQTNMSSGRGMFKGKAIPMASLAAHLSSVLGRPVLDITELKGGYDFSLQWTPDEAPSDVSSGPSLISALQEQLGLRLESRKAPIEMVVIDRAERVPVEN